MLRRRLKAGLIVALVMMKHITTLLVVVVLLGYADSAVAQLQGHHAKGGWGLQSGTQVPEGFFIAPVYTRFDSETLRNADGDKVNQQGSLGVNALSAFLWWVSPYKILGANYGIQASVPLLESSVEVASLNLETSWGLGDLYVQPINLGWHLKQADIMASFGVYFPLGRYDADAIDNTGLGMWTYEFGAGTTVYFDEAKNWHLAATGYLEFHSGNKDSDAKVGEILTVEGGLGRSFFDGSLLVGVAYYGQWKLGGDTFGRPLLDDLLMPEKHRVYGIGPDVTLPLVIKKKLIALVTLRYQWETGARTNLEGQNFNVLVTFPFFRDPPQ